MEIKANKIILNTEEENTYIRLERIFMPEATKQRENFYSTGKTSEEGIHTVKFVHYTSAEAALNIIKTKRIWMRNAVSMTDYRELQHGYELINKFFDKDAFINALDKSAPNAGKEAIDLFYQWWGSGAIQLQTYIASVSEHLPKEDLHGRLSMWRAFGGNTARVAIIFEVPWLSKGADALNIQFSPVAYLTENEICSVFAKVISNITENSAFLRNIEYKEILKIVFHMLMSGVTCLKHDGFEEEREWRASYSPQLWPSDFMEHSIEVISGIPQVVYKVPIDVNVSNSLADLDFSKIFNRLIIGPTSYPWSIYEAFYTTLTEVGIEPNDLNLAISGIPLRS